MIFVESRELQGWWLTDSNKPGQRVNRMEEEDRMLDTVSIPQEYKRVSRKFHPESTCVQTNGVVIGGKKIVIMAGPCSVESSLQIYEIAHIVQKEGASILRGGAFKPRSSPYSFRGLGEEGLQLLAAVHEATGLPIITEVMSTEQIPLVARYSDILQIGARNMQNFALLCAVGRIEKPILLKRGMGNTIHELLMAAEYILDAGNSQVILCERGIRTFEPMSRNTFDINAIPILKDLTHLPIIADPSHGTGNAKYVPSIAKAAIAAGADGILVEVHPNPAEAFSDGDQSLCPEEFRTFMSDIERIAEAIGRTLH
jgi:3-deoxy-7-phosphoheptulonate synthase